MLSAFIVCVACATAASRTLFAMGREGVLPKALGHTSPRFQTPVNATICVTVLATVMALLIGYPFSDSAFGEPFSNYYFWATTGTLLIIVVYIMLCIGGIVFFYRTRDSRRWNPLVHVVGAADRRGRVRRGPVRLGPPDPGGHLGLDTVLALIWLAVGVGVLLWLRAQPAGSGRADRLDPRRGGWRRRRRSSTSRPRARPAPEQPRRRACAGRRALQSEAWLTVIKVDAGPRRVARQVLVRRRPRKSSRSWPTRTAIPSSTARERSALVQ